MGCVEDCQVLFEYEKKKEISSSYGINRNSKIKDLEKYDEVKFNFNYLKLNRNLEEELQKLLKKSVQSKKIDLNSNNTFKGVDVQKENKNIITKIKKQLINYKSTSKNYLMKRAVFLKKIGYLVRFSQETAIYMFQYLLSIFKKENAIHSKENDLIKLNFSSWIKELFNENCFQKISKNENIYAQVKNEIEKEINSKNEKEFLKKIFPDIIKLYFHCFLVDIKVDIKYAKENSEFDSDYMIDILLTGLEDDKNILFTFLPGLYGNEAYFDNSHIYVTTYPINNPNKFPFQKPIFKNIESDINIETDERMIKTETTK